jgi:hypothetical protein
MSTSYTGTISLSNSDQPALGDGDENDFYVSASGSISLSLTLNGSTVSGTSTVSSISTSGFTNDDIDGDNDAFSNPASSGSGTASGTTSAITSVIALSDGGTITISGNFTDSSDTTINGTAEIIDNGPDGRALDLVVPITLTGNPFPTLFTAGVDTVNFNALTSTQQTALQNGADKYHGLGGNDTVTLPSIANLNESIGGGKTLGWTQTAASTFFTGSLAGQVYTVVGSDANYFINLGAGRDSIILNPGQTVPTETITGFIAGDTIDFQSKPSLTLSAAFSNNGGQIPGEVDLYSGKSLVATLVFTGSTAGTFVDTLEPIADGTGGTEIIVDPTNVQLSNPTGTSINWSFTAQYEGGNLLAPYVPPTNSKTGAVSASSTSGVTVGIGVDLAAGKIHQTTWVSKAGVTFAGFTQLFPNYASNPDLQFLFNATNTATTATGSNTAPRGQAAVSYLSNNGVEIIGSQPGFSGLEPTSQSVSITQSQANLLSNTAEQYQLDELLAVWSQKTSIPFTSLPAQAQTVLNDVYYQYDVDRLLTNTSSTGQFFADFLAAAATNSTTNPTGFADAWAAVVNDLYEWGSYQSRNNARAAQLEQLSGVAAAYNTLYAANGSSTLEVGTVVASNDANAESYNFAITGTTTQYAIDPSGATTYTLVEKAGSPSISSIMLPLADANEYAVSYEIGTAWSAPQSVLPLQTLTLPANVHALQVGLEDASGNPVADPGDFTFFVKFATTGTFSGNVFHSGYSIVREDFTASGTSDVLWRNTTTGEVDTWLMSNGKVSGGSGIGSVSSAWQALGTGDFNGDGTSDILWRNTVTGEVDTWLMNNGKVSGGSGIGSVSSAWQFAGTGDFNGDFTTDVLWRNTVTGEVDTWLMNNGKVSGGSGIGSVSSAWQALGTGDFNGDGTSDMRNTNTGEVDTWLMNNGRVTGGSPIGNVSSAWQFLGTGDFNGDGTSDVLWRNTTTGEVDDWLMSNGHMSGGFAVGTVSSRWQFAGVGDFTGNGTTDILWHNTVSPPPPLPPGVGAVDTWLMSNGQMAPGGTTIGSASTAWVPAT